MVARAQRQSQRRAILASWRLAGAHPLQLPPGTAEESTAKRWFNDYRPAGIEGLVVKGIGSTHTSGRRRWVKVKSRETTEVIIGAVTGSIERPQTVIAGLIRDGELQIVGKSTPLLSAGEESPSRECRDEIHADDARGAR